MDLTSYLTNKLITNENHDDSNSNRSVSNSCLLTLPIKDTTTAAMNNNNNSKTTTKTSITNNSNISTTTTTEKTNNPDANTTNNKLIMMQLPVGWSMNDLLSNDENNNDSNNNCYFIAHSGNNKKNNSKQNQQDDQVCFVVESKKQSFTVNRLETSNCLVLVPEVSTKGEEAARLPPLAKKQKLETSASSSSPHPVVPSRLLSNPGGTGASFLELKPTTVDSVQIFQYLLLSSKNSVLNLKRLQQLNSTNPIGKTVKNLAHALKCSQHQVLHPIRCTELQSHIMEFCVNKDSYVCVLSQELIQETQFAILNVLIENDEEFTNFDTKGIDSKVFIPLAAEEMLKLHYHGDITTRSEHSYPYQLMQHLVQHVLQQMLSDGSSFTNKDCGSSSSSSQRIKLDISKISICVLHRVFQQKQKQEWEESELELEWQMNMPGNNNAAKHNNKDIDELLRGVAVQVKQEGPPNNNNSNDNKNTTRYWKYFPVHSIQNILLNTKKKDEAAAAPTFYNPNNMETCFQGLFAIKPYWTQQELEPYLKSILDIVHYYPPQKNKNQDNDLEETTVVDQEQVLLQYTKTTTKPNKKLLVASQITTMDNEPPMYYCSKKAT